MALTVVKSSGIDITGNYTVNGMTITANVSAANANLGNSVTANYFIGNGALLTGIAAGYSNTNVAAYLPTYTGNVSADYFIGNGSTLTYITGANITGNVTSAVQSHFANIANSVAGSNISGQVGNALVAGTVYTNAQPNITSVGTLSSLTVTGNITSGNASLGNLATATYFSGDGSLLTGLPASYSNTNVAAYLPTYTGNVSANYFIGNGATLTYITGSNVNGNVTSAVQSHYANIANSVAGSNVSGQVGNALVAGTVYTNAQPNITSVGTLVSLNVSGDATVTGNFTVSGNTTYINVETFRVEDPIIELGGGVNGAPLISNDGKDRGSLLHYYTTGVVDAFMGWDNSNGEFAFGSNVSVSSEVVTFNSFGNIRANYFIGNGSTLTDITGSNVSGNVTSAVQSHFANIANSVAGSNVSGQVGNALVAGTVYTNAQPNITSVGTLVSLTVTGNITSGNASLGNLATATYFSGDGSLLTGITGTYSNSNVAAYLPTYTGNFSAGNANISGSITTGSGSGNISGANYVVANYFSGNGSLLTSITGANVSGNVTSAVQSHFANIANSVTGGNVSGQVGNALVAGTVYTNAQPNITSIGSLTSLTVTGNVSADYFIGNGSLLTGLPSSYSNANVAAYLPTYTGNFTAGNANISGSLVAGTITTGSGTGNISGANYVVANYFSGNGSLLTSLTGANVTGNVTSAVQSHFANIANSVAGSNISGQVSNALVAGTVYTNAQPNITSVGTLSSLTVTGNITSGNASLGNLATATYFSGDGSLLTGLPAGYANSNVAAYLPTYTGNVSANYFIGNGSTLTTITGANVTGNVTSAVQAHYANIANSVTGSNVSGQVGNALVAGTVYTNAQPNITSVGTLTSLTITGNITSGNADLGNLVTANYFSGNGSLLTGITSSSATTAGTVTTNAQPNITSVGSLSGLTVSNATGIVDFTTTANVTLGNVSNLHITGGTANYVLSTNGSGTLSWVAQSGGTTTATIDNFTGNGVQTVFTLSTTPSSENDTIINYNGAILQKDVYSLSGSDITFVAPPASGSSLEITTLGVVSTSGLTTTGKAIAMAIVFGF
jgi:hypothetical protein